MSRCLLISNLPFKIELLIFTTGSTILPFSKQHHRLLSCLSQKHKGHPLVSSIPHSPHPIHQLALLMRLQDISGIPPLFPIFTTPNPVQATIISYLDYYGNLSIGLPAFTLSPLQLILHKVTTMNY